MSDRTEPGAPLPRARISCVPTPVQERGPFAATPPTRYRPLGGYAILTGTFAAAATAFSAWYARSDRKAPQRVSTGDIALVAVTTHKASRLLGD